MYNNIHKEMCKKINKMSDNVLLRLVSSLDMDVLDKIVEFAMLKEEADEVEANLEKGKEDD